MSVAARGRDPRHLAVLIAPPCSTTALASASPVRPASHLRRGSAFSSPRRAQLRPATIGLVALAAIGAVQFYGPVAHRRSAPFRRVSGRSLVIEAVASANAFGSSREVKIRFALPDAPVDFPLELRGDPTGLSYAWVPLTDTAAVGSYRALGGLHILAPGKPGYYRLRVARHDGSARQTMAEPILAVMVPFTEKVGGWLNGYRMGTYLAERLAGHPDRPDGFLEVSERDLDLPVSKHFRLADFVNRDGQQGVWPKYVALNPRLLDKLELVIEKLAERRPPSVEGDLAPDVHSGFRTPVHNSHVRRSARDSRHQYGDAADVAIDANGDGKITVEDGLLVAEAVDEVEREHPELVGGLGLYTSRRHRTPYVHIDARGRRSRWHG